MPGERRDAVADLLMDDELWSGWGVRTMAADEGAYNPLVYHDGTVWPHDNVEGVWGNREVPHTKRKRGQRGGNMVSPTGASRR